MKGPNRWLGVEGESGECRSGSQRFMKVDHIETFIAERANRA